MNWVEKLWRRLKDHSLLTLVLTALTVVIGLGAWLLPRGSGDADNTTNAGRDAIDANGDVTITNNIGAQGSSSAGRAELGARIRPIFKVGCHETDQSTDQDSRVPFAIIMPMVTGTKYDELVNAEIRNTYSRFIDDRPLYDISLEEGMWALDDPSECPLGSVFPLSDTFGLVVNFETTFVSDDIASIIVRQSWMGAHEYGAIDSILFDLDSGRRLTPRTLLRADDDARLRFVDTLCAEIALAQSFDYCAKSRSELVGHIEADRPFIAFDGRSILFEFDDCELESCAGSVNEVRVPLEAIVDTFADDSVFRTLST